MIDALRARLRLHDNWHDLLFRAWSVRFALFASACEATVMLCSFFTDAPGVLRIVFAVLGFFATLGAAAARLMPQANLPAPTEREAP